MTKLGKRLSVSCNPHAVRNRRTDRPAQPIVGMFPPPSLVSSACPPKVFDFYDAKMADLHEFTVDVDFVIHRTALVHGVSSCYSLYGLGLIDQLASWFDLAFTPRPPPSTPASTQAELEAWDFSVGSSAQTWPWMQAENPLNPANPPPAPKGGLDVQLSTGPNVPRTHWQ